VPGDIVFLELTDFDLEEIDYAQSGDELYIAQTGLAPHIITRHDHDCWELSQITFTDQPGDWDADKGWPETVTFFQQRLVYGCNILKTHTVWCSKASDFHVFTTGTDDDDGFSFTLDSGTQNKIQWMSARKTLNIGTLGNEWIVTGATTQAITPTNLLAERQTNNGSERLKPLTVNFANLFVERHGRSVNEFVYDYTFDSYKVVDLSILAPHLTESYSVIDWAYQQTPYNIVWSTLESGDLLGMTYQRQHKVVGWHKHTTEGLFKAVAVIPNRGSREDDLWAIVRRSNGYLLEKKANEFIGATTSIEGRFLDSFAVYDSVPVDTITGLSHLDGETVSVLADDNKPISSTRIFNKEIDD